MSPTKEVFAAYCDLPFIEVEKYMRGKLTWDELRKLAEERKCPVGFVGRGLVCVLEKSSCGAQVMAFCTVASGPNLRREMPGLGLRQRGDSDFHYTSFWKYRLPDDVLIVHVECDWLEVLCRLQYKSIRTILPFLDWMCGWRRIYIEQELDAKCMLFDMKFRVGYFQDGEDILAWHVAENWNAWEMGKITIERRLKMVASCFDVEFSKREFDSLCPSSQLSMHRERRARLRRLACSVAVLHKLCGVFWGDSGENVVPLGVSFRGGHPLEFLAWSSDWNRTSLLDTVDVHSISLFSKRRGLGGGGT
ncbi:hypothetical protein [Verrucomicrobium spinosum]|uniref:hypothetical protein n=1 Tax=Verrucomicrobium spinosum TaxID=2736 RepID=UPI0009464058|nr:hypothetical protein [Verrucomicrobium spinosum]